MPLNNLRQADVPVGADAIPNPIGTAPGVRAEIDGKVVYAVPGVPYEMQRMINEDVIPDLLERAGESAVIVSRSLKTWGQSESGLAEMIAHRVDVQTNPTIAFLARGIEGLVVRLTAKAGSEEDARSLIETEEAELRVILGALVFGTDDETIEHAALHALEAKGWTLGVAESLTAGLISSRIGAVPGASRTFRGAVVSYATDVKRDVLDVGADLVVSEQAAIEMAVGAAGCSARTSGSRPPASPVPTSRTANRWAPCGSRSRCPTGSPRRSRSGSRATASVCGSSRPSRC